MIVRGWLEDVWMARFTAETRQKIWLARASVCLELVASIREPEEIRRLNQRAADYQRAASMEVAANV